MDLRIPATSQPRLVIIGGGFGGIELAQKLSQLDIQIVLLDKHNYHTFQPLLYQVATAGLEPGSIAYPLRRLLRKVPNAIFRMAEVLEINTETKSLLTDIGAIDYNYLVIATGSTTNFFNLKPEVSGKMKQLKSIPQALDLRSFILENFEEALLAKDEAKKQELLNIAIVGGGPTGVELAGALGEMKNNILPKDYPELDFRKMQVHLFEANSSLLAAMSENARERALKYVKSFGVNVWLNTAVTDYDGDELTLNNGKKISTETVIWTAGVKGAMVKGLPETCYLPNGRIQVDEFNRVKEVSDIFAIGDIAHMVTKEYPKGHPMVAPVAMQQGILLAENIEKFMKNKPAKPFVYFDKGSMATIGRNKAVVDFPKNLTSLGGFPAWFAWMFVHVMSLIGFRNKLIVIAGWLYNYFNYDQTLRLIIRPSKRDRDKV
jgi:NADH dehydrogenase